MKLGLKGEINKIKEIILDCTHVYIYLQRIDARNLDIFS